MSARLLGQAGWETVAAASKYQPFEMAKRCKISVRQLQLLFKDQFQKHPKLWLREVRCRSAVEMLRKGLPGKVIAQELGYASHSHLCHDFWKLHGKSPKRVAFG